MIQKIATFILLTVTILVLASCDKKDDTKPDNEVPGSPETPLFKNYSIETDKAVYNPGDEVSFTISGTALPANLKVRYKHLGEVIAEESISGIRWTWTAPNSDFRGYLAEVYSIEDDTETIYATIGVDVSSDWTRFPRYGFLSKFPQLSQSEVDAVVGNLNRYHINGLQFYDWHNKHHQPLPVNNGTPADTWKDIINRDIYFSTVEKYIASAHERNMSAMFYNLIYGAWNNAEEDGVGEEWYVYKDQNHSSKDFHPLPSPPFQSNIYLLDPSNTEWQDYVANENQKVYQHLNFDGFHMDQLGDRGTRYTYDGNPVDLSQTFKPFIESMKNANPDKDHILNAVNQYGQEEIAQSPSDVLYTEVWSPNDRYSDLANIIKLNNSYSNGTKKTILAAYMNYDMADSEGYFNTPGVLMTNAVIFAFGGSHLELGEHMLGNEYFPNDNLSMKPDLKNALPNYYDFLVAYENLLRDGGTFNNVAITSLDGKLPIGGWPAGQGSVASIGRKVDNKQVIHLINFIDSETSYWRDNEGNQAVPGLVKNGQLSVKVEKTVKNVWVASPDIIGGAARNLEFSENDGRIAFTVPELKYWTMLVIEYE